MYEKEPQKPPEHTSEHIKSQNFLGACPQTPLTQSILWGPFLYLPWAPPILSAALPECMRYASYWTSLMPSDSKVEGIILEGGMFVTVGVVCIYLYANLA